MKLVVIGGNPAGLSAASAVRRASRKKKHSSSHFSRGLICKF